MLQRCMACRRPATHTILACDDAGSVWKCVVHGAELRDLPSPVVVEIANGWHYLPVYNLSMFRFVLYGFELE